MNELQQLEQFLNELLSGIQEVIQSGEILSDEFQGTIAQELDYLTTRIDELRAAGQAGDITPNVPELDPGPFPSSNINAFKYDPDSQELFIKFQDKYPRTQGATYRYSGVPAFIFEVFRRGAVVPKTSGKNAWHRWRKGVAPSLGASAYALIRSGGYPYQRLT